MMRTRRLEVRLTRDEAAWIASKARTRGLNLTDYVRAAALRGSRLSSTARRRKLPVEAAISVRQLTDVAAELRRLIALAATRPIPEDEARACLAQVAAAIRGLAA